MNYGIFGNMNTVDKGNVKGTLSLESLDYGMESRELMAALEHDRQQLRYIELSLESIIKLETNIGLLDNKLDDIDKDLFINALNDISLESMKLLGKDNELSDELNNIAELANEDFQLALEEYKKKRNKFIDQLIRKIWDSLELIVSGDAWMSGLNSLQHLFTSESKRLEQLKVYTDDLKSKSRVIRKDIELSHKTRRMLGVYSCKESEFDFKKLGELLSDTHKLFKDGLIEIGLKDVHDSLVQSINNEVSLETHGESLKYIKQFKRIDLPEVDIRDIKMAVPIHIVDSVFGVLTIVQDRADGMDYEHIVRKIPEELYEELKIGKLSENDIIDINNLLEDIIPELRKQTNKKHMKRTLIEFVKNLRSKLASLLYSSLFGIFALRRYIRQVYLANIFINHLIAIQIAQYGEWTKVVELQLRLIEETTEPV